MSATAWSLTILGVVYLALILRIVWIIAEHRGWRQGFDQGCDIWRPLADEFHEQLKKRA